MDPHPNDAAGTPVVLVPGHWLGAWAWSDVEARLRELGHEVESVSLPGTTAGDPPSTTLTDQMNALTAVVARQSSPPALVAHSGAGRVATGVIDRNPTSVRQVIFVDSGPAEDGTAFDESVEEGGEDDAQGSDAPVGQLPEWDDLESGGASLEGLDDAQKEQFRERAVPVPRGVLSERLALHDDTRRDVPTTIIACSMPSEAMMGMAREGHPMFAEVARLRALSLVDLPTGHWPMWSRPVDLADAIAAIASADSAAADSDRRETEGSGGQ